LNRREILVLFIFNNFLEPLTKRLLIPIFKDWTRALRKYRLGVWEFHQFHQGGAPMEWIEVGTTGGFLMGALAVLAAGGFMFFLGKNME
jgi:hypothetical protein